MSGDEPKAQTAVRAKGVTPAERYLQRLCERTFLTLWSYPGVFRDQKSAGKGDGKELCDLLVVFGDNILIFSDKSCAFPDTGSTQLDWSRWFRRAVIKSAEQIWGAERWLCEHPNRVFLDRRCTQPLPLELPLHGRARIHRIVVAHKVAHRCASYFGDASSGTLTFDSGLHGEAHHSPIDRCRPFEVGWLDPSRDFVHVLDDQSLEILLRTRDTITDFCEYLRWKEELLRTARDRNVRLIHTGEEELLAKYLGTWTDNRHGFTLPADSNVVFLEAGDWTAFQASPERRAQIEADHISYAWDELIETFNKNILGGTSYDMTTVLISDRERIMRFLAREPRLRRRMLAEAFLGLIRKAKPTERRTRIVRPSNPGEPYYCFLVLPHLFGRPYEEYRAVRGHLLEALCLVTKVVFPDALDVIGLATNPGIDESHRSEDSLYLDARVWSEEMQAHASKLQADLNLLTNYTTFEDKAREFPGTAHERIVVPGPNPRNRPCPCGSGKKYKKCHGR
jgi:hypothetical protein